MINNKNYTRDQLKEILEDELFQNLLFHTADNCCHHSFTRNNKYSKNSSLIEDDFDSINRQIKLKNLDEIKPSKYFFLVALHYLKDDIDKSVENLEKFLEVYDKPVENNLMDLLTEYAFKAANYTNVYEEDGDTLASALYLMFIQNFRDAIPLFEKAPINSSKLAEETSLCGLACCYFGINKFDKAMGYFDKFLSLCPDNLDIYGFLGNYYKSIKEYDKAIKNFNIAKEYFNKHHPKVKDNKRITYNYKGLIECYSKTGKIDELIQHFEELLSSNPDNEVLWTYLAICYQAKEEYDKAFEIIDKALSINPNYSEALKILGVNYYYKKSYKRSIYYFKESIKVKYDEPDTYYYLGRSYLKTNEFDEAIKIFKIILSKWSTNGYSYFALGSIYEYLGKDDLASESFEKASKFKPFYIDEYEKIVFK